MTDAQLEETLKGMGQEVTAESKKNMRKMMENSAEMLKTMKLKGGSTEFHSQISSPDLNKSDFKYTVPEGTVLKDSLFSGMFSQTNSGSAKQSLGVVTNMPAN